MGLERVHFLIIVLLAVSTLPALAFGQSSAAIRRYLSEQNKDCSLYAYQEYFRGTIPDADSPITIASYTLESCGGGNNWGRTVGVFYETNGRVQQYKGPSTPISGPDVDDPNGVVILGDQMTVRYSDYGPEDGRCCPSLRRIAQYRLANNRIDPMDYASSQAPALHLECYSYARFVEGHSFTVMDIIALPELNEYFGTDLSHLPDKTLEDIANQAKACATSFYSQANAADARGNRSEQGYLNRLGTGLLYTGVLSLQRVRSDKKKAQDEEADARRNQDILASIPDCEDEKAVSGLRAFLANNPDPELQSIKIIGLKNIRDESSIAVMGSRVCRANSLLNSGEHEIVYTYHWFNKSEGQLSYTVKIF